MLIVHFLLTLAPQKPCAADRLLKTCNVGRGPSRRKHQTLTEPHCRTRNATTEKTPNFACAIRRETSRMTKPGKVFGALASRTSSCSCVTRLGGEIPTPCQLSTPTTRPSSYEGKATEFTRILKKKKKTFSCWNVWNAEPNICAHAPARALSR